MPVAADLAAVLNQRADEIEAACSGLGDADAARRPSDGVWCVREHLSHLHGDDRDTFLDGVQRVLIEGTTEIDVAQGITHYTVDRRQVPLAHLLGAVTRQYRTLGDISAALTPDEIDRRVRIDLLRETPFGENPRLGEWLVAIADMHLPDHIAAIRETRASLGA
jgi:hypothetical protein